MLGVVFVVPVIYIIGQLASPNIKEMAGEEIAPGDWHGKLKQTGDTIKSKQAATTVPTSVEDAINTGERTSSVTLEGFRGKVDTRVGHRGSGRSS